MYEVLNHFWTLVGGYEFGQDDNSILEKIKTDLTELSHHRYFVDIMHPMWFFNWIDVKPTYLQDFQDITIIPFIINFIKSKFRSSFGGRLTNEVLREYISILSNGIGSNYLNMLNILILPTNFEQTQLLPYGVLRYTLLNEKLLNVVL